MKNYKEYKETTPENTINIIRSILNDLDLLLLDSNANRDNIFACRVILGNHNLAKLGIGMNGKGSTFEYALASGYAEFMEKIQNRFLCDYMHSYYGTKEFVNTLPSNSKYKEKLHQENIVLEFRYDEREEYWPLEKVLTSFGNELMLLYHANNIEELKSILIDVIKIEENHILMIPCFSQKDNNEIFIPIDLILHAIGSNGMTAGNSEKEALLHGFCEIFERYALKNIYYKELTPPTIPIEEFSETPVYEKIKYLIEKKGYEIIIKDCSLGKGLPVYGTIIIDKQNHLYNFKLGSDFVPYIAVDRCLNEVYQSTKGFIGLPINFACNNNKKNEISQEVIDSNYHKILESSSGIWPLSILSPIPSYEYTGENPNWGLSNDDDLKYCFNIIKQLGFNIYIRNNSITGFPTYYIIIPGMNQVLFSRKAYEEKFKYGILRYMKSYPQLVNMSPDDAKNLAKGIESRLEGGYTIDITHDYFLFNTDECILNLNINIFLCLLFYFAEDYVNAKKHIDTYIKHKSVKNQYLTAFSDYIQFAKIEKIPLNDVKFIMSQIHGKKLASEVISDLSSPQKILQYYDLPTCFKCESCKIEKNCQYFKILKIEKKSMKCL